MHVLIAGNVLNFTNLPNFADFANRYRQKKSVTARKTMTDLIFQVQIIA